MNLICVRIKKPTTTMRIVVTTAATTTFVFPTRLRVLPDCRTISIIVLTIVPTKPSGTDLTVNYS